MAYKYNIMRPIALTLVVFAFIVSTLPACKKSKNNGPVQPAYGDRVKMIHTSGSGNDEYFIYDKQGRLITDSTVAGGKTTYTYYVDSVIEMNGHQKIKFFLNSAGLADSVFADYGSSVARPRYIYDADGRMVKMIEYDNNHNIGEIDSFVVNNGNRIAVYATSNGYCFKVEVTTFDNEHFNTIGFEYTGRSFFGKSDKNLVLTDSVGAQIHSYQYTYDTKNRVSTQVNGNYKTTYTYY
jgi:hypothetical protein